MLTKKQNLRETIHGGSPDRFVKSYEYMELLMDPISLGIFKPCPKGGYAVSAWGVTDYWSPNALGPMPLHDAEHTVIKDITLWEDQIITAPLDYPEDQWDVLKAQYDAVDKDEVFPAMFLGNGIFEKMHYHLSIEEALVAFYEEPEAVEALLNYYANWEIAQAERILDHITPGAIFHHDDWGTQINSFLPPDMFAEFFLPIYKRIYGLWREAGVEVIVHHSDCYCANLVPTMIEMGIDVWQGVTAENNIPELLKTYGGKISFMGGLNNGVYDKPETTPEQFDEGFRALFDACPENGKHFLIPGLTQGDPGSVYEGINVMCMESIDRMSKEYF